MLGVVEHHGRDPLIQRLALPAAAASARVDLKAALAIEIDEGQCPLTVARPVAVETFAEMTCEPRRL